MFVRMLNCFLGEMDCAVSQQKERVVTAPAKKYSIDSQFSRRGFSSVPLSGSGISVSVLSQVRSLIDTKRNLVVAALAFALIAVFFTPILVVPGFIALGAASRMYQRYLGIQLGIELITFGMVMCGMLYGPIAAIIVGLVALPLSVVFTQEKAKYVPVALCGMALVGYLAGTLAFSNLVFFGLALTVVYDITTCAAYYMIFRSGIISNALFMGSHLAFNYFAFSKLGPLVLTVLA